MLVLTGALTSKPYAFTSRPWELRSVQSIDVLDGLGSNIRIDFKESEILRILPRKNSDINENWISDKIRFFYDGLKRQRIASPYGKQNGDLKKLKWKKLLPKLSSLLKVYSYEYGPSKIGLLSGSNVDTESLFSIRHFALNFGFSFLGTDREIDLNLDSPKNYKFENKLKDFKDVDYCLFLGVNPRFEASILNVRFRKLYRETETHFDSIGGSFSTTYPVNFWGLTSNSLLKVAEGKHPICKNLVKAKKPVFVIGSKIFERYDAKGLDLLLKTISKNFFTLYGKKLSLNFLQSEANSVGSFELGITPISYDSLHSLKVLYCVGVENKKLLGHVSTIKNLPVLIFQTSHGSPLVNSADFVMPSTTFVEKTSIYYNTEGRPQNTQKALVGPLLARDDWKIFQVLSTFLNKATSYNTKSELISQCSKILPSSYFANSWFSKCEKELGFFSSFAKSKKERITLSPFKLSIEDFYMTSLFCESSRTMAKASESLRSYSHNYKFLNFISYKK